jgi:hypothetical protein
MVAKDLWLGFRPEFAFPAIFKMFNPLNFLIRPVHLANDPLSERRACSFVGADRKMILSERG